MNQNARASRGTQVEGCRATYMVTIDGGLEGIGRTFLVSESCDFLAFVLQAPLGRIVSVSLLMAPALPGVDIWEAIPIRYVDMLLPCASLPVSTPMLTSHDGRVFGGFPLTALRWPPESAPVRLAEFRRLHICATSCTGYSQRKALDAAERQEHHP